MTSLLYNLIIAENYINSSNKESFSECYEVIKYTSVMIISIIKLYWLPHNTQRRIPSSLNGSQGVHLQKYNIKESF